MNIDSDDFTLFDLPRRFAVDPEQVDIRWRALQAQVHPDRFVAQGAAAQRVASQWAVRVNEAHRRLRDPVNRAAYLCELAGTSVDAERNTAMPLDFLQHQMSWRESLDEAESVDALRALMAEVAAFRSDALVSLEQTLDQRADYEAAAQQTRALMFVERFAGDVERRLQALGQ